MDYVLEACIWRFMPTLENSHASVRSAGCPGCGQRVLACVVMMGKAAACYSVRAKQCRYSLAISGGNFSK